MRCYTALQFDHPELNALRDVWNEVAAKHPPTRADFDARKLKPFLRNIAIIERVTSGSAPARYRIRLHGSAIAQWFGEQTGHFIDEFIPQRTLPRWTAGYDVVFAHGAPLRFISRFELPQINYLDGESFSAPLVDEAGNTNLVLSAMYTQRKDLFRTVAS